MKKKLVDIKIRPEFRDILKEYCEWTGDKMYVVVERLIKKHCQLPKSDNVLPSQHIDKKII